MPSPTNAIRKRTKLQKNELLTSGPPHSRDRDRLSTSNKAFRTSGQRAIGSDAMSGPKCWRSTIRIHSHTTLNPKRILDVLGGPEGLNTILRALAKSVAQAKRKRRAA